LTSEHETKTILTVYNSLNRFLYKQGMYMQASLFIKMFSSTRHLIYRPISPVPFSLECCIDVFGKKNVLWLNSGRKYKLIRLYDTGHGQVEM
jgi:hypothetical protein